MPESAMDGEALATTARLALLAWSEVTGEGEP